ncbi:MAG: hypothetical protein JRN68_10200 [Nitrososphaerota archaeon]|jgi:hypothetical protein|nr:hypothetical protein [Nitrososphaerota archaeon]
MPTYLVEHRWKEGSERSVRKVLSKLIDRVSSETPSSRFQLLNVLVNRDDSCAECIWESPSRKELEEHLSHLELPTIHSISEVQILYGLEKIVKAV